MITKKTKYAVKALIALAGEFEGKRPVLISDLAAKERIPKKFLESILLELKNKGVLHSKKGKGGGYLLAANPSEIMLGTVMRIIEGPLAPLPCLSKTAYKKCDECTDELSCGIRLVMKDIHESNLKILEGTSLRDVMGKIKNVQTEPMYSI